MPRYAVRVIRRWFVLGRQIAIARDHGSPDAELYQAARGMVDIQAAVAGAIILLTGVVIVAVALLALLVR